MRRARATGPLFPRGRHAGPVGAGLLSLALSGCGSTPPPEATPARAPAPPTTAARIASSEAPLPPPDSALANRVLWLHINAPGRDLPALAAHLPAKQGGRADVLEKLAKPADFFVEALGQAPGGTVDLEQPADVLAIIADPALNRPALAFAVTLARDKADAATFSGAFKLTPKAGGRFGIEREVSRIFGSGDTCGKRYTKFGVAERPYNDPTRSREPHTSIDYREIPIRPADGLPEGSLHFAVLTRPLKLADPSASPHRATHIFVGPDGAGTWIAVAENEALGRAKMRQTLTSPPAGTLAGRDDLASLRAAAGAGAGFVSLVGRDDFLLPDGAKGEMLCARNLLSTKPSATAIPFQWTSVKAPGSAGPCRARLSTEVGPEVLSAIVDFLF